MKVPRLLLAALVAALVAPAGAAAPTRCSGAAARAPAHQPCPAQRPGVQPTPGQAQLQPGPPCTPVRAQDLVAPCAFGEPARSAQGFVALIGDSHAAHWRAALAVVARRRHLRAYAVTRNSCPFSTADRDIAEPYRSQCERWKQELPAWLADHPQVRTVVLVQGAPGVLAPAAGGPRRAVRRRGGQLRRRLADAPGVRPAHRGHPRHAGGPL